MQGKTVTKIRELQQLQLTQADLAKRLGVSLRTINNWEGNNSELPIAVAHQLRTTYAESFLKEALEKLTDDAFDAVPSEVINVWVVERAQCILFAGGERLATKIDETESAFKFDAKKTRQIGIPTLLIPLEQKGLTTYPLRTGATLTLSRDEIANHEEKRHKGIDAAIYSVSGRCRSLLYIPMFEPSGWGPLPVLSLCFQNRLTGSMELPKENPPEFSDPDEAQGRHIAEKHKKTMVELLSELDMFEANRQL